MVGVLPPLRPQRGGTGRRPCDAGRADLRRRGGTGETLRRPSVPLPGPAPRDRGRGLAEEPGHRRIRRAAQGILRRGRRARRRRGDDRPEARAHVGGPPSAGARAARRRQDRGTAREPAPARGGSGVRGLRAGQSAAGSVRSAAACAAASRGSAARAERAGPGAAGRDAARRRPPQRSAPRAVRPAGPGATRQRQDVRPARG